MSDLSSGIAGASPGPVDLRWTGRVADLSPADRAALFDRAAAMDSEAATAADAIIEDVRERGDAALFDMARRFDGAELDALEVPRSEWDSAWEGLHASVRSGLERAAINIEVFHRAQVPDPVRVETEPGVVLERRVEPVARAGVYAPGGTASYPSSVLMGAVPARAVGVNEVIVCSPPGPDGHVAAAVLAAARVARADRLFAIGGAGAIAAMSLGTQSVPRVDVVVGPGNRYVNEAKRAVAGTVRIDSPAGPSELLVVADSEAGAADIAGEMLAQAEHDPDACVGVVVYEGARGGGSAAAADVVRRIGDALSEAVGTAPRGAIARRALAQAGFLLVAKDEAEAVAFAQAYAAEHLCVLAVDPGRVATKLTTAGTVFVGRSSSVAFGDYLTGANHVLPTGGLSRSFSGLDAAQFMRSYTVQTVSDEAAARLSEPTAVLAEAEGLPGHAAAARRVASADRRAASAECTAGTSESASGRSASQGGAP